MSDRAWISRLATTDDVLFRALTERSLEFVSILGRRGRFRYLNHSVLTTLGYAPEELLGTDGMHLVHDDDRARVTEGFALLARSAPRTIADMMLRLHHKDGSFRFFEGSAQNLLHEPAVRGIATNARDVTQRVEAERSTLALADRFRLFVEAAHEAIWAVESTGATVYVNPRTVTLLGYSRDELGAGSIFDFMTPESVAPAHATFSHGTSEGLVELEFVCKDGHVVTALVTGTRIVGDGTSFSGILAMLTDITPRKLAQSGMAEVSRLADVDRRRLEATLQAIPIGVWIADASGRIVHSNPAAAFIWRGPVPPVGDADAYADYRMRYTRGGAELESSDHAIARALRTGVTVAGEIREITRFDGTLGHIIASAAPILDSGGQIIGAVGVNVDISEHEVAAQERERLLATLEIERTRLAMVFERAPAFLAVLTGLEYVFEQVNPAYRTMVGNRPLIGIRLCDALPEIKNQGFIELLGRVRATGVPFVGSQVPVRLNRESDGEAETLYLDFVYQRLSDSESDDRLVIHGVDVTEQVVAVAALRRSEERLRDQFAKLPVPTFLWERLDDDFVLIDTNDAAKLSTPPQWTGAIGKSSTELFPDGWAIRDDVERCLRDGIVIHRSTDNDVGTEVEGRTFDLTIGPQPPDRVLVHAIDTTEQRQLASQLRQSQKMEAIGQLAGGVAHDFNNLLTVIGAHSSFLLADLAADDVRRTDALAIQQAGDRAAGLTRQLLAFSRKQVLTLTAMDVSAVVENTQRMLSRILGADIAMELSFSATPVWAMIDVGQIEQVLMNLVINARDALPDGGRITISTCVATITTELTGSGGRHDAVPVGSYARLSVADDGVGMDTKTQARIFEPFFTTKGAGKGTGLGLATVYGIVKQSGGYLTLQSAVGAGARFDVYFPLVHADSSRPRATAEIPVIASEMGRA